jgi:predicted NACHT family NTPase
MINHFNHSPTVGSHDAKPSYEELQARLTQMEKRLDDAERQQKVKPEKKPRKFKLPKKIGKFFNKYIRPAIDMVSRFLSSIASVKRAFA